MKETAIKAALQKAGYDTAPDRLAVLATKVLSKVACNPERCVVRFDEIVNSDRTLRRAMALAYLQARAADMRNERPGEGVHIKLDSQCSDGDSARSTNLPEGGEGVHVSDDSHRTVGALETSREPSTDCLDSINGMEASDESGASRNYPGRPVNIEEITQIRSSKGRFLGMPTPLQKRAALQAGAQAGASLFANYQISDGRYLGQIRWFQIDTILNKSKRDSDILRRIKAAGVPHDERLTIDEVLGADVLENIMKDVLEPENAA